MAVQKARERLEAAELSYSQLPMMVKMQAGAVILPMIDCLRVLLGEIERMKGAGNAATTEKS